MCKCEPAGKACQVLSVRVYPRRGQSLELSWENFAIDFGIF